MSKLNRYEWKQFEHTVFAIKYVKLAWRGLETCRLNAVRKHIAEFTLTISFINDALKNQSSLISSSLMIS